MTRNGNKMFHCKFLLMSLHSLQNVPFLFTQEKDSLSFVSLHCLILSNAVFELEPILFNVMYSEEQTSFLSVTTVEQLIDGSVIGKV